MFLKHVVCSCSCAHLAFLSETSNAVDVEYAQRKPTQKLHFLIHLVGRRNPGFFLEVWGVGSDPSLQTHCVKLARFPRQVALKGLKPKQYWVLKLHAKSRAF